MVNYIFFLILFFSTQLTENTENSNYTYVLTINSHTADTQLFDLKVTSHYDSLEQAVILELKDLETPYKRTLGAGRHEIEVRSLAEGVELEAKVQGILDGEKKGLAMGSAENLVLRAGPGGFYEVL